MCVCIYIHIYIYVSVYVHVSIYYILCIYYSTILYSSLNEMLSFTYYYFHISWTLPSKSHKKRCYSIVYKFCVCVFFIIFYSIYLSIFYYMGMLFCRVWFFFFSSEPEIILYYKCDVSMNRDINVLCYDWNVFCNKLVSSCEDTHITISN